MSMNTITNPSNKRAVWAIVFLVGGYVLCQAVADVGATKFVDLGGIVLPAGSLMFALTFTLRDLVHKRLGKVWAQAAIVAAGTFNVVQSLYLAWMGRIPAPVWFEAADAWSTIFALIPSITFASIIAEVASQWVDTEVYDFWRRAVNLPQWTRVLASNAVSLPLDSFVFGTLAFSVLPLVFGGEVLPLGTALNLVVGQIVWKAAVTVVSLPGIYLVREGSIVERFGL
jgi:hypothetical protein